MQLTEKKHFTRPSHQRDASGADKFKFNHSKRTFSQQYAKFYETRLQCLSRKLEDAAKQKWGNDLPVRQVCDVVTGETCILIGTAFKQMELQPSILKELNDELNLPPQPLTENFTSDDDVLFLEDMLQRIQLIGDIKAADFVTGVNLAVKGKEEEKNPGCFRVEDISFADLSQPDLPDISEDCEVLFLSGIEIGGSNTNEMALTMLSDYIRGGLGSAEEASKICRVFIAGNSITQEAHDKEQHYKAKYLTKHIAAGTVDAIKNLNTYLQSLTETIPVTIMPGEHDVSNCVLPQQPLHPCLFKDESGMLETATNPYTCTINGVHILGDSGQPTTNIKKYSKIESSAEIMKKCLTWHHIAPTAPDTLAAYPYTDTDPFILESCPHVYFAGNQNKLEAEYFTHDGKKCLCLALPKFCETGLCVKVNLRNLEWEPLQFGSYQ